MTMSPTGHRSATAINLEVRIRFWLRRNQSNPDLITDTDRRGNCSFPMATPTKGASLPRTRTICTTVHLRQGPSRRIDLATSTATKKQAELSRPLVIYRAVSLRATTSRGCPPRRRMLQFRWTICVPLRNCRNPLSQVSYISIVDDGWYHVISLFVCRNTATRKLRHFKGEWDGKTNSTQSARSVHWGDLER